MAGRGRGAEHAHSMLGVSSTPSLDATMTLACRQGSVPPRIFRVFDRTCPAKVARVVAGWIAAPMKRKGRSFWRGANRPFQHYAVREVSAAIHNNRPITSPGFTKRPEDAVVGIALDSRRNGGKAGATFSPREAQGVAISLEARVMS